jgi:ATP-binding cassette, subfamily B, bacterial PglK
VTAQPISSLLKRLWYHLSSEHRVQFCLLLLLMIAASIAEIMSIGALLPFLSALTNPDRVFLHPDAQFLIRVLGINSSSQLLLPLTVTFAVAALVAGSVRLILTWASTRLSFAAGADLSIGIYRRTLYQPYAVHVARNSSEVINGIVAKSSGVIYGTMGPMLVLISSLFMLVAILAILLWVDPVVSMFAFSGFGAIYGLIVWFTRKRKLANSLLIARESTRVIKSLQEGLGGIRDVLVEGSQEAYCKTYRSADQPLRQAQGSNQFIGQAPRFGVEALGMVLIAVLAYALAKQPDGVATAMPVLGALALGAQRMLPIMQQAYASWSSIQGGQVSLQDTLDLLDQPLPHYADQLPSVPIAFQQKVHLKSLSFRYAPQSPWVIKDLDLHITKGSRVGFIGSTGSGKTTLLDIVMGLLEPTEGSINVDGKEITRANHRNWQTHIAHVPQAIFLADSTIEENIAFGQPIEQIDRHRVMQAARKAQIADSIESWPKRYQTIVGERGIRLSGGQRQRIGIARALYKQAEVIVFDEATSALDNETEQAVMEAIDGLSQDLTVLIIAHRLTTLKNCTQIVELGEGRVRRIGTYQDIVTSVG